MNSFLHIRDSDLRRCTLNSEPLNSVLRTPIFCTLNAVFFAEGGCSVPVAVNTKVLDNGLSLEGGVWSIDGKEKLTGKRTVSFAEGASLQGDDEPQSKKCRSNVNFAAVFADLFQHEALTAAEKCGRLLAADLISRGAEKILREAKAANDTKQT